MGDPNSLVLQATQLKNDGRYDEAAEILKRALTLSPRDPEAHRVLGLVYCFTGMFDESIQELETAVNLSPDNLTARVDLALTYSMLGMAPEAKAQLQEVLKMDPSNEAAQRHIIYFDDEE